MEVLLWELPGMVTNTIGNARLLQTAEAFINDADGNLTVDDRWTNYWDGENQLAGMLLTMRLEQPGKQQRSKAMSCLTGQRQRMPERVSEFMNWKNGDEELPPKWMQPLSGLKTCLDNTQRSFFVATLG